MLYSIVIAIIAGTLILKNKQISHWVNTHPPLSFKLLKIRSPLYSNNPRVLIFLRILLYFIGFGFLLAAYMNLIWQ